MAFYHGSPVGGLTELTPFLSEHGKPYLYFATNPLVALLYAVKPVPKPFSFYPYGFDREGHVVFSEYYENAFYDIYKGRKGYLYSCHALPGACNPTQIHCAYVCEEPVTPDEVREIPDLYAYYKEQEGNGAFLLKPFRSISGKEMSLVFAALKNDMEQYGLRSVPEHPMSVFIREHFPAVWEK
ncbi:MAG: hypothetical protein ACI3WR_01640 [Oscillospiraceae bacterium]